MLTRFAYFISCALTLVSVSSRAQDLPSFGASAELHLPFPVENSTADAERARIRSVEITSNAKLDALTPALKGRLTLGANDLAGALVFNLREGFLVAENLLPNLDLRIGKFFLPVGLLNQTRKSAWNFISSPYAFVRFFDDNAVADTGLDVVYHVSSPLKIRIGVTNGYRYDSSIQNGGSRPMTPTHFLRPQYDFTWSESRLAVGLNYLSRMSDAGDVTRLSGVDLSYGPTKDSRFDWSAQGELYDRGVTPAGLPVTEDIGGYGWVERGLGDLALGGRIDYYQVRSLTDLSGAHRPNLILGLTPTATYRGRDHLLVQASYTYMSETRAGNADRSEQVIELRLVTDFGDMPKFRTPSVDPSWL